MQFMIMRNGVASGPFSAEQLKALLDSGEIGVGTPVRWEKMHRWWLPSDFEWHPVGLMFRRHKYEVRIPRQTIITWTCIVVAGLALLVIRIFFVK